MENKTTTKTVHSDANDLYTFGFSVENSYIYNNNTTLPQQGGDIERKEDFVGVRNMKNPIEEYAKYLRGKYENEETVDYYLKLVKPFVRRMDWRLKRLTQEDIDEYVQWCRKNRQHNGNTARFYTIQRFLDWCGYDLKLPKQRMLPTNKHALTKEQLIALCETTKTMSWRHQLLFTLEIICLRRPKDIRNLKINDKHGDILRYVDKTSRITGIKKEVLSKWTMKAWDSYVFLERPTPKTDEDSQYLILSDCTKFYGQHLKSNVMIDRITAEIQRKSGIPTPNNEKSVNYLFKRTGTTQQAHICNNLKIIKDQGGWNNIETVMIYDRTQDDDTRKHLENFEEVISRKKDYNRTQRKDQEVINKITNDGEQIPRISYNPMDEDDNHSYSFSISIIFSQKINQNFCALSDNQAHPVFPYLSELGANPSGRTNIFLEKMYQNEMR